MFYGTLSTLLNALQTAASSPASSRLHVGYCLLIFLAEATRLLTMSVGRVPNKAPQVTGAELLNNFPTSNFAASGPLSTLALGFGK